MAPLRDYEIYLLFLLLVTFHGSSKCEIHSPVQKIYRVFFTMFHFKFRHQKRRPFISERDVRRNDFRTQRWLSTFFVFQNLDLMWGFQSRNK